MTHQKNLKYLIFCSSLIILASGTNAIAVIPAQLVLKKSAHTIFSMCKCLIKAGPTVGFRLIHNVKSASLSKKIAVVTAGTASIALIKMAWQHYWKKEIPKPLTKPVSPIKRPNFIKKPIQSTAPKSTDKGKLDPSVNSTTPSIINPTDHQTCSQQTEPNKANSTNQSAEPQTPSKPTLQASSPASLQQSFRLWTGSRLNQIKQQLQKIPDTIRQLSKKAENTKGPCQQSIPEEQPLMTIKETAEDVQQPIVLAYNCNLFSKNDNSSNLIANAKSTLSMLSGLSCTTIAKLAWNSKYLQQRGDKLETTPGITNRVKKLFKELEAENYGPFTPANIHSICEAGIKPVLDRVALDKIKAIQQLAIPSIMIGSQDSLEYEIFNQKVNQNCKVDLDSYFDGIVTIPTLEEETDFDGDFIQRDSNWFVARDCLPSPSFTHTVESLAQAIQPQSQVLVVENQEQLNRIYEAATKIDAEKISQTQINQILQQAALSSTSE